MTSRAGGRRPPPTPSPPVPWARRWVWPALVVLTAAAVVGLGAFPIRSYLAKRQELATAEGRLAELEATNDAGRRRLEALGTDAEIERLAREQYGLVKEGEEAYRILPPPEPPVRIPPVWPFGPLNRRLAG